MDDSKLTDEIRKLLDARRPGSADESLMEMRELSDWLEAEPDNLLLAKRAEFADELIADSLYDVEIPDGLYDRLISATENKADVKTDFVELESFEKSASQVLAGVLESQSKGSSIAESALAHSALDSSTVDDSPTSVESTSTADASPGSSRRTILIVAASVAGLFLLGLFSMWITGQFQPAQPISVAASELRDQAANWDPKPFEPWDDLASAPADYPVSYETNAKATRWKEFKNQYDSDGVVYDLTPTGDKQIYLFVFKPKKHLFDLPEVFEGPIYPSSSWVIDAYQRSGLVYVLVVEGSQSRYHQVIKSSIGVG